MQGVLPWLAELQPNVIRQKTTEALIRQLGWMIYTRFPKKHCCHLRPMKALRCLSDAVMIAEQVTAAEMGVQLSPQRRAGSACPFQAQFTATRIESLSGAFRA